MIRKHSSARSFSTLSSPVLLLSTKWIHTWQEAELSNRYGPCSKREWKAERPCWNLFGLPRRQETCLLLSSKVISDFRTVLQGAGKVCVRNAAIKKEPGEGSFATCDRPIKTEPRESSSATAPARRIKTEPTSARGKKTAKPETSKPETSKRPRPPSLEDPYSPLTMRHRSHTTTTATTTTPRTTSPPVPSPTSPLTPRTHSSTDSSLPRTRHCSRSRRK